VVKHLVHLLRAWRSDRGNTDKRITLRQIVVYQPAMVCIDKVTVVVNRYHVPTANFVQDFLILDRFLNVFCIQIEKHLDVVFVAVRGVVVNIHRATALTQTVPATV